MGERLDTKQKKKTKQIKNMNRRTSNGCPAFPERHPVFIPLRQRSVSTGYEHKAPCVYIRRDTGLCVCIDIGNEIVQLCKQ